MKYLLSKAKNYFYKSKKDKPIKENKKTLIFNTSFDTYNIETSNLLNPCTFTGIKTEIYKTVSPYLQISHISNINSDFDSRQTYGTFCFNNFLVQSSIDQDKLIRIRGTHMFNNIFTKFHTVIGRSKDIFTQVEVDLKNKFNIFCIKMIQPALKGASCVYVGNYMQQLGVFSIGGEIIKADEYLGLSFVGRYDTTKSVSTISLQHFNTVTVDYYRRLSSLLDVGIKVSTNKEKTFSYGLGVKVHSKKGEVIGSIDNKNILSIVYNDKLSEGLSLNMSCRMGKNLFEYGYGFIYEF